MIKNLNLSKIYFTQGNFTGGNFSGCPAEHTLVNLLEKLKTGQANIKEITEKNPLNVYVSKKSELRVGNTSYSCNNRKFCVYKAYESYLKKKFPTVLTNKASLSIYVHIAKTPVVKSPDDKIIVVKSPVEKSIVVKSPVEKIIVVKSPVEKSIVVKSPVEKSIVVKSPVEKIKTDTQKARLSSKILFSITPTKKSCKQETRKENLRTKSK
jgi:hypothetical protein